MPASRTDQSRSLLYHAREATPFRSIDGQPCATIPTSTESRILVPLRSAEFRDWLFSNFYKEFETAPSASAYRDALRTLEAQARFTNFPEQRVNHRLSFVGDPFLPNKIVLDLANSRGEVLEISSRGWSLQTTQQHAFRSSTSTLALPRPTPGEEALPSASLTQLRTLLNLRNDKTWSRILVWLTAALRPSGPYPILVLCGPTGSGKSLLARILCSLIDPSAAPLHRLPASDRELLQRAFHNWILAFDLVHRIPHKIAETLCAISSGDAVELTQPDLREPIAFQVARPIILIAPHDETQTAWTPPRTLANRTLTIWLERIARPRPESAIWSDFAALHPAALGTIANAAVTALHRIRDIDLGNVPRFPDAAAWTAAAAPALGLDESAVINAFADPASVWTGSDPLREAIHALLVPTGVWTGEAADLLNQLRATVPLATLPSTPKALSQALPSIAGIRVTKNRHQNQRALTITKIDDASQKIGAGDVTQ
jgi:hypothetical protein